MNFFAWLERVRTRLAAPTLVEPAPGAPALPGRPLRGIRPPGGGHPASPGPEPDLGPPDQLPPLTLAYVGDAVYELFVRERLLRTGRGWRSGKLHRAATGYVRAQGQAAALRALAGDLTELEAAVVRRGRNAKARHVRNVDPAEYAQATAFEALVGYLYLAGQDQRLAQVLEQAARATPEPPP